MIWNGEETVASWYSVGGNRPTGDKLGVNQRKDVNMFDDNILTPWVGYMPATEHNGITVTFHSPITFHRLVLTAGYGGNEAYYNVKNFRNVCLFLDDLQSYCTPSSEDPGVSGKIIFDVGKRENVKKVKLVWRELDTNAVVAEFQIYYQTICKFLLIQLIIICIMY